LTKSLYECKGYNQWRDDGVAAASSEGGPTGIGAPDSFRIIMINFNVWFEK